MASYALVCRLFGLLTSSDQLDGIGEDTEVSVCVDINGGHCQLKLHAV